jgi:uncharacterized membrane protein
MSALGWFHTATALVALASGAAVLLRRKGTLWHRRIGWTYVVSMILLNVTALMIYRLFGHFGPSHIAALVSLVTVLGGIVTAVRLELVAGAFAEVATRVPGARFW